MPKNASESITIQLQCPRIHEELVTNQARFFGIGEFVTCNVNILHVDGISFII